MDMKLSIIIASYNRAASLLQFVRELSHQVVPDNVDWEVVIVDNNSTDGTRSAIAPLVEENSRRYKYLLESRQGKSMALNTGRRAATGEILVFTDDDCVPDPKWLATIAMEFASDASLSVLGGRVELYDKQDRPVTIRNFPDRTLIESRDQLFLFLIGANMSIRRKVLDAVGEFDPFLGPGSRIGAVMEDLDLLYRVYRKKFKIVYSPDVLVYHNHGRATEAQIQALPEVLPEVLNCTPNSNVYKVVKPSNSVSSNVSPNLSGLPSICALPSTEPATWYIKTTTDGGGTWHWADTLGSLGLGKN